MRYFSHRDANWDYYVGLDIGGKVYIINKEDLSIRKSLLGYTKQEIENYVSIGSWIEEFDTEKKNIVIQKFKFDIDLEKNVVIVWAIWESMGIETIVATFTDINLDAPFMTMLNLPVDYAAYILEEFNRLKNLGFPTKG